MCVRYEQTGRLLSKGETIVPGVGVVQLEQDLHIAARNGHIFQLWNNRMKKINNSKNYDH
jgi:hypothetical protein